VLLTENVADFARISGEHLLAGQHDHPGVLIAASLAGWLWTASSTSQAPGKG
jgi:hypothetical protein